MSASLLKVITLISVIYSQLGGYVSPAKYDTCSEPPRLSYTLSHVLGFIIPPEDFIRRYNSPFELVCMEYEMFKFRTKIDIKMYYTKPELDSKKCSSSRQEGDIRNKDITNYRFGWTFMESWRCYKDDIDIEILYECGRYVNDIESNGTLIRESTSSIKFEPKFQMLNASLIKNCTKTGECESPVQCIHASLCGTLRVIDGIKKDVVKGKSNLPLLILLIIFVLMIGLYIIY